MEVNKQDTDDVIKLTELWEERNVHEYNWIKQSLSVVSILLGLVITLKSGDSENMTEHILFIITILSNALCILCGLIFLHRETDTLHTLSIQYAEYIHLPENKKPLNLITASPKKFYGILKKGFFVFLFSSVISLVAYAIVSDNVGMKKETVESVK